MADTAALKAAATACGFESRPGHDKDESVGHDKDESVGHDKDESVGHDKDETVGASAERTQHTTLGRGDPH
jgi:hypothetical protein